MDRIKGENPYDCKQGWENNECFECMKPSCAPCKKLHPCPKPSLLVCGQGLPCELEGSRGYKHNDEECAFVEVDTTCLCNPVVKVDFSANIYAEVKSKYYNKVKLVFKLVKVCENSACATLGRWYFERDLDKYYYGGGGGDEQPEDPADIGDGNEDVDDGAEDINEAIDLQQTNGRSVVVLETQDSFCFTYCECQGCSGCCTYKVIVENKSKGYADVNIKDIQINAIAQSK